MNAKPPFSLNERTISQLNACSAQGMNREAAAEEIGISVRTLCRAVRAQNLTEWFAMKFPPKKGGFCEGHEQRPTEMRWLKPEEIVVPLDIDWGSVYVRSAAMSWRGAA